MFEHYPIHDFIDSRLKELGFRRGELARRCGYKNISKGVRRIDQVCGGDLGSPSAKILLEAMPAALEVDVDAVRSAIEATIKVSILGSDANLMQPFIAPRSAWAAIAALTVATMLLRRAAPSPEGICKPSARATRRRARHGRIQSPRTAVGNGRAGARGGRPRYKR
jgi:hypothetical protein